MTTSLATIDQEWRRLATTALLTIERNGQCRHAMSFYRYDRHLAMALFRWPDPDNDEDTLRAWAELGALAAGLKADTAVCMMDAWSNRATDEEMASADYVRPGEDPRSVEALQGIALNEKGIFAVYVQIPYTRGDHGEITPGKAEVGDTAGTISDSAAAFVEAMRTAPRGVDPLAAVRHAVTLGHVVVYEGKTYATSG